MSSPRESCPDIKEHLLPWGEVKHHPWLDRDQIRKGMRATRAPKEEAVAKQKYEDAGEPFPPPPMSNMASSQLAADFGVPPDTQFFLDLLETRENMMLFLKGKQQLLKMSAQDGGIIFLPIEKSWRWFAPAHGHAMTVCARSKILVGVFCDSTPCIRPLVPAELFSLQGATLADLMSDSKDPELILATMWNYGDVRRLTGNAFHTPSALAAVTAAVLSVEEET